MSVREEDRRKNSCSSRGLGIAAAAIGVGVGAALYYFFSKRPENPDTEGSTSDGWSVEQPQSLNITSSPKSEYTTISEHTTTDTSIWITDNNESITSSRKKHHIKLNKCSVKKQRKRSLLTSDSSSSDSNDITMDSSYEDYEDSSCCDSCNNRSSSPESCGCCNNSASSPESEYTLTDTEASNGESSRSESSENTLTDSEASNGESSQSELDDSMEDEESQASDSEHDSSLETEYVTLRTTSSHSNNRTQDAMSDSDMENEWDITNSFDSDMENEWDITNSSADVPNYSSYNSSPFIRNLISRLTSPRLQNVTSRERRWSLEECAICFEVMLKDQPLMQLPCTHNFHVACIGPWLQEQQTCPMCRKAAE